MVRHGVGGPGNDWFGSYLAEQFTGIDACILPYVSLAVVFNSSSMGRPGPQIAVSIGRKAWPPPVALDFLLSAYAIQAGFSSV